MTADALRDDLVALFRRGADTPLPPGDFGSLALSVFAAQFEADPAYRRYCERRGASPGTVTDWRCVPPVPARAFKDVAFASGPRGARSAVFATSGTTAGPSRRGVHHVPDLALYDASALATFRRFVLPDAPDCRIVSLIPPPAESPESSLSYMAGLVMEAHGREESGWYADPETGLDQDGIERALQEACVAGEPVLLVGTTLAFAAWLDRLGAGGRSFRLPDGSRLMDTGGSKGRRRVLRPGELRRACREHLGIAEHRCVNEYGMTELCSQYYERSLLLGAREPGDPKGSAPWLACVAADPDTLAPLPDGDVGVLRHVDLANLGSVVAVQTEDRGRVVDGAVELHGRSAGAEARGCSLALELMLEE